MCILLIFLRAIQSFVALQFVGGGGTVKIHGVEASGAEIRNCVYAW